MVKVLFVCMGNICRSPMAEGVFRRMLEGIGLAEKVYVDSAGTHSYHIGAPPDTRSQATALRRGVDLRSIRARQVTETDLVEFDYVLAMDRDNFEHLRALVPEPGVAAPRSTVSGFRPGFARAGSAGSVLRGVGRFRAGDGLGRGSGAGPADRHSGTLPDLNVRPESKGAGIPAPCFSRPSSRRLVLGGGLRRWRWRGRLDGLGREFGGFLRERNTGGGFGGDRRGGGFRLGLAGNRNSQQLLSPMAACQSAASSGAARAGASGR